jgi:hypothetical protein
VHGHDSFKVGVVALLTEWRIADWRCNSEKLGNLYSATITANMSKSRIVGLVGHVERIEEIRICNKHR